jgi:hypothetical protein
MSANMAKLSQDLHQAQTMVGGVVKSMETALSGLQRAFGALGIGLGAGAFVSLIKGSIDAAAGLDDIAEKTGAAVEELSKLEQVARIGGHSMEIAGSALIRLSKALHGSDEEAKGAGKALAALGLSADALRGKDTAEALRIVAVELNKYADGSGKSALALDLLGKSGAQALPFLKDLATEQGISARVTAEQAAAAEDFQKSLKRLGNELHGVTQALAVVAVPALNDWLAANREALRIGGSMTEMLRLFVFNLEAMTTEKPGEQIKRLTGELERLKAAMAGPWWKQSGIDIWTGAQKLEDIPKQVEFLKFLQRQEALALGGTDTPGEMQRFGLSGQKRGLDYAGSGGKDDSELKKYQDMLDRYRKLDAAGWVKHIDDQSAEYERGLAEDAKLTEAFYKEKDRLQALDQKSVFDMIDAEQEHAIEVGRILTQDVTDNHKDLEEAARLAKAETERAADDARRAQSDMWRDVDRTAHDTFVNIFNTGTDAFTRLRDTLKNTLLDLLYQMTIRKWIFQIAASVTGGAAGTAAASGNTITSTGGGTNILNSISNAGGLNNLLGSAGSGAIGQAIYGNPVAYASAVPGLSLTSGFQAGSQAAMLAEQTASFGAEGLALTANSASYASGAASALGTLGSYAPYIGAAIQLAQGNVKGAIGTAAGAYLGTMILPGIGTAIGAVLGSLISSLGGKAPAEGTGYSFIGSFDPNTGSTVDEVRAHYKAGEQVGYDLGNPASHQKVFQDAIGATWADFKAVATGLRLDPSTIGKMDYGVHVEGNLGHGDEVASPAAAAQLLNQWAKQLIPNIADFATKGEAVIETFVRLKSEMDLTDKIIEVMGKDSVSAFGAVGLAGIEMRDKLVALMGGLNDAATLTQSFYENFYTATEGHAANLALVNAAIGQLGVTVPTTRQEFRKLVEAQDLSTAAGQEMFAGLIKLAPAFASVTQAMDEAIDRTPEFAASIKDAQDALRQAYRAQASDLQQSVSQWAAAAKTLRDYGASLTSGAGGISYAAAARQFAIVSAQARAGSADAMGQLPSVSEAFRSASLANSTTATAYARDVAKIQLAVADAAKMADQQASIAQRQLDAVTAQVSALITINDSVLSVQGAITALAAALDVADRYAKSKAEAELAAAAEAEAALAARAAIAAAQASSAAAAAAAAAQAAAATAAAPAALAAAPAPVTDALQYITRFDNDEGRNRYFDLNGNEIRDMQDYLSRLPGHAMGGIASGWSMVGEQGPELVNFTDPGRVYTASQTRTALSGEGGSEALLREVTTKLDEANAALRAIAFATRRTAKDIDKWDKDGMPVERDITV